LRAVDPLDEAAGQAVQGDPASSLDRKISRAANEGGATYRTDQICRARTCLARRDCLWLRTCCDTAAATLWQTRATSPGRCRLGSATKTSNTPFDTPNLHRIGLRTSGDEDGPALDTGAQACHRQPRFKTFQTCAGDQPASRW